MRSLGRRSACPDRQRDHRPRQRADGHAERQRCHHGHRHHHERQARLARDGCRCAHGGRDRPARPRRHARGRQRRDQQRHTLRDNPCPNLSQHQAPPDPCGSGRARCRVGIFCNHGQLGLRGLGRALPIHRRQRGRDRRRECRHARDPAAGHGWNRQRRHQEREIPDLRVRRFPAHVVGGERAGRDQLRRDPRSERRWRRPGLQWDRLRGGRLWRLRRS